MHILWQRRVNADDAHPYWYPHQTRGGSIREERLIFPLTPGESWESAKPIVLPEDCRKPAALVAAEQKQLEMAKAEKREKAKQRRAEREAVKQAAEPVYRTVVIAGKLKKIRLQKPQQAQTSLAVAEPATAGKVEKVELKKVKKPVLKHEKNAIAFCRELRDRWQQRVTQEPWMVQGRGKYDVSRQLSDQGARALPMPEVAETRLLEAA
jgi:hypothetical protein